MKLIFRIARTELATLFYSPIAWFILIVFSLLSAMKFADIIDSYITSVELGYYKGLSVSLSATIFSGDYGYLSSITRNLYIYIPLLTMGLMSRETASGSIKLLFSSPITSSQIILGKYLASIIYGLLLLAIPIIGTIFVGFNIPNFDWGVVLTGLLGLYFLVAAYSAIGLFMSSITSYQVVAAVGTLVILAALSFIGTIGQEYAFIREITYWLSISGRAMQMISGLICSDDVIYFIIVIALFLSLSIMKISFERSSKSKLNMSMRYLSIVVVAMTIGYISSRPSMMGFIDTTRTKTQTITKKSQAVITGENSEAEEELSNETKDILRGLKGKLTITSYVNLVDNKSFNHFPTNIKNDERTFSSYVRFKPDIEMKYVYYWDTITAPGAINNLKGMTVEQKANYLATVYKLDMGMFKTPSQIRHMIDLSGEDNRFVRIIERENGQKSYLRDFEDMTSIPTEAEISAALKKLTMTPPIVGFVKGQGEREIEKEGDRDYSLFGKNLYFRYGIVNQGFDAKEVDLTLVSDIPEDINILFIADSKAPYNKEQMEIIERYIARGGNMFILTETARQSSMNPLTKLFGVKIEDGILAQPIADFYPNLILSKATAEGAKLNYIFDEIHRKGERVSMPGAIALDIIGGTEFENIPLLATNETGAWIELETDDLIENKVKCTPEAGEVEKQYYTAVAARRNINGKEQKIIITGDADCISNAELAIQRSGYRSANFSLITGGFRWLSDNQFPIDTRRPNMHDNNLKLVSDSVSTIKAVFIGVIPGIMLLLFLAIQIRRRKN